MSCDTGAKIGAEIAIEFAIGCPADDPLSLVFKPLGMARSKSFDTAIDTIDVTADKSLGDRRQFITSYKTDTIDIDGVSYQDVIHNQKELRNHVKFGNVAGPTGGRPFVWLKILHPVYEQIEYYPMIASNWSDTGVYDDAITWSTSFTSAGAPSFEEVTP